MLSLSLSFLSENIGCGMIGEGNKPFDSGFLNVAIKNCEQSRMDTIKKNTYEFVVLVSRFWCCDVAWSLKIDLGGHSHLVVLITDWMWR